MACLIILSILPLGNIPSVLASETYGYETVTSEDAWALQPEIAPNSIFIESENKTFFMYSIAIGGASANHQDYMIRYYDHTTGTLSNAYEVGNTDDLPAGTGNNQALDSHMAPSIGYLWNGSFIVFYHAHTSAIRYRVSNGAYNHDSWYSERTNSTLLYTYPQVLSYNNVLYLFIRVSIGTNDAEWRRFTFDSNNLWRASTTIIDDASVSLDQGSMYAMFSDESNSNYVVMSGSLRNATGTDRRVNVHFAMSLDRGITWQKADGTSLSLPLGGTGLTNINTTLRVEEMIHSTSTSHAHIGVNNTPHILQIWGRVTNPYDSGVKHFVWTGSAWSSGWAVDQDGVNLTRNLHPTNFGLHGFRDFNFNRTTFWFYSPTTSKIARYTISELETDHVFIKMLDTDLSTHYDIQSYSTKNAVYPFESFIYYGEATLQNLFMYNYASYFYTFLSKYNEDTGSRYASDREIDVTAYFSDGTPSETFTVDGTYYFGSATQPLYFSEAIDSSTREYWVQSTETTATIYIFNQTLTTYTISFIDLTGVLDDHPFITAERLINGTMMVVEKRKVDVEKKIQMSLQSGRHYNIVISNGTSYTFGDLLMTPITFITLTLKGLDFPEEVILAYQYVRIYAERYNNYSTIKVTYQDTQGDLADVSVDIYFENETVAASTSYDDTSAFVYTWLLAQYNETYTVRVVITHSTYGTMNYNSILYRGDYNVNPWNFNIGTIPYVNTADILPTFILFGSFLIFSKANAYVGAFFSVGMAVILCRLGWLSIPASALLAGGVFTIMVGITYAKRRTYI